MQDSQNSENVSSARQPFFNTTINATTPEKIEPKTKRTNIIVKQIRSNPGKTLYIALILLSFLSTFLPWVDTNLGSENFYDLVQLSSLSISYVAALVLMLIIRIYIWRKHTFAIKYKDIFLFTEDFLLGGIVFFSLTALGSQDDLGRLLSIVFNLSILAYIIYIKFIKTFNNENHPSRTY